MTELKKGDRVRVIVEGTVQVAYADRRADYGTVTITYPTEHEQAARLTVYENAEAVRIEHIAPAAWPPRPGDLWRDRDGELWFFHAHANDKKQIIGRTADGLRWYSADKSSDFGGLIDTNSPWTLVRREDNDPAEEKA